MTDRTPNKEELFDGVLLGIAQKHAGGINDFLDTFFSFLVRKTDFFSQPEKAKTTIKQFVESASETFQNKYVEPPKVTELPRPQKVQASESRVEVLDDDVCVEETATTTEIKAPAKIDGSVAPNAGNGADFGHYSFTQTLSELEVRVPLPQLHRSKELTVQIETDSVVVKSRDGGSVFLSGPLTHRIKASDSMWTLDNGTAVCLQLTKHNQQEWWKTVIQGDAEIDLSKVCPENSKLDDLDGETRKTVEKMMYDQRQKQMGLPTSDDAKKNEMLQKFMAAHPEMDFSQAKMG